MYKKCFVSDLYSLNTSYISVNSEYGGGGGGGGGGDNDNNDDDDGGGGGGGGGGDDDDDDRINKTSIYN